MNRYATAVLAATGMALATAAAADYTVTINRISDQGVAEKLGTVRITGSEAGGIVLAPDVKGLPPGERGFHIHEKGSCAPAVKDGKPQAGEAAGPHYDPHKTGNHAGVSGGGHVGDLPPLNVDSTGLATKPVAAPRLKLSEIKGRALMIHAGGDNNADQPLPNGGGGARIACGVIK